MHCYSNRPDGRAPGLPSLTASRTAEPIQPEITAPLPERLPALPLVQPLRRRLARPPSPALLDDLRRAETIGRPIGDEAFITALEATTNRTLRPGKRGPKPKDS